MENSNSPVKSNVLIMNVTDNGIVCTVESSRTEDAVLCFLSHERAALLDIVVPTKAVLCVIFIALRGYSSYCTV